VRQLEEISSKRMSPSVKFQPKVSQDILAGINKLAEVIRPTLGPLPRNIIISPPNSHHDQSPEFLDCGGVIAQRIYQIEDSGENVGVMMMRQALCALLEEVGDGTSTAALLYQKIFSEGWRYIASGGNAIRLRQSLEKGLHLLLKEINKLSISFHKDQVDIQRFVQTHCPDSELASLFSEILDTIGEDGYIFVLPSQKRSITRLYIRGSHWQGGLHSIPNEQSDATVELHHPAILISDLDINEPGDLFPLLNLLFSSDIKSIVLIANSISEKALSLLFANKKAGKFDFMVVKPPYYKIGESHQAIEDVAVITGGKPLLKITGDLLSRISFPQLGFARNAWANKDGFGIVSGNGALQERKSQFHKLKKEACRTDSADDKEILLQRISNYWGGAAIVYVGGKTESEAKTRLNAAKRCVKIFRSAFTQGLLPGAGIAYLVCREKLKDLYQPANEDEKAAFRILYNALEVPARVLAQNSGYDPSVILRGFEKHYSASMSPLDYVGFDARDGKMVNLFSAGILDLVEAQREALRYAVLGASQALSVEIVIHPKQPALSLKP